MALKFMKKGAAAPETNADEGTSSATSNTATKTETKASSSATSTSTKTSSAPTGKKSIFKKGAAAKEAIDKAEAEAEARKAAAGSTFRFRMKQGDEHTLTFLDGNLDEDGMLDVPHFHQHTVKVNGQWMDFVCIAEEEPCPICEEGTHKAALVAALTVIDHTPYEIKSGQNQGKTIKNQRRLYVCKRETINRLVKMAGKRDGLAGCTFEVSRSKSDNSPNVGDQFDFVKKHDSYESIAQQWGIEVDQVKPLDYEEELKAMSAEEMVALGVGKKIGGGIGSEKGVDTKKLADEL